MPQDEIKEIQDLLQKGPATIIENYFKLLEKLDLLTSVAKLTNNDVARIAGISESQLYRRKKDPELWEKTELLKLVGYIDDKIHTQNQIHNEKQPATKEQIDLLKKRLLEVGHFQLSDQLTLKKFFASHANSLGASQVLQSLNKVTDHQSAVEVLKELNRSVKSSNKDITRSI